MKRGGIAGLCAVLFSLGSAAGEHPHACPVVPVFDGDFPDPFVLRVGESYYAYSTNARGANIPVLRSENLTDWREAGDALPELPEWAEPGFLNWAPAAVQVAEETFVLFYTTRFREEGRQAISFATGNSPAGPFTDRSDEPFVYQKEWGGSIDPEVFRDVDGTLYLLWKSDANALNLPAALYIGQLAPDAQAFEGEPVKLLETDADWEEPLIENPSLLERGGRYYLIYSANWWESERYAVGYATGPSPLGPFEKRENGPILASHGKRERGPGGASFFRDADGRPWIAYHAWAALAPNYRAGGKRSLHLAQVRFDGDRLRFVRWSGKPATCDENFQQEKIDDRNREDRSQ